MDVIVAATLGLRRAIRHGWPLALASVLGAVIVLGVASGSWGVGLALSSALGAWLLVRACARKARGPAWTPAATEASRGWRASLGDIELGVALALPLYTLLLRRDGALDGALTPLVYALVAFLAAACTPRATGVVVTWMLLLELGIRRVLLDESDWTPLVLRAAFALSFASLAFVFLRAEAVRMHSRAKNTVERELAKAQVEARQYRLLAAGEAKDETGSVRMLRSSVEEIHQSVHDTLDLLRYSLGLHTAVLLWSNDAETHFRISELASQSNDINDAPIPYGDGVLGVVSSRRERVVLSNLKPSYRVPYYNGPCPVRELLAVPIVRGGAPSSLVQSTPNSRRERTMLGLLVVDRADKRPFTPAEEERVAKAARACQRAIENERTFLQLERAKVEQGKLYRAAEALAAARSESEVVQAAVRSAREIASFDLAAVTVFDEVTRMHQIVAAEGAAEPLTGERFAHNTGLCSMVVETRFPLPYKGDASRDKPTVFAKSISFPEHPSLLVLPLMQQGNVLGTLVLGAKRKHAFTDSTRSMLEVLSSHLAVSLANARMVAKLETMATTDGLTGLANKRAMLAAASESIARATRFSRKLSVVVTDIDFFKKVNDTYGHDIGDVVIKGLGEILKRCKRATDVVARFGGEEFVALCEGTDEEGALLFAERIREELENTEFETPLGPLKVTCSLGVATFPEAGADWDAVFKAADTALYESKRGGRNRVSVHARRRVSERVMQGSARPIPVSVVPTRRSAR